MTNTVGTPGYIGQVQQMNASTPAYGPTFDGIHQQLLNNDAFLNSEILGMLQKAVNSGVIDWNAGFSLGAVATQPGQIYTSVSTGWANSFGIGNFKALVNGILLAISNYSMSSQGQSNILGTPLSSIQLDTPPTANVSPSIPGSARDDLVFLEFWLDATTGAPKYRIRVVDGVDFASFPEGLGASLQTTYGAAPYNQIVQAQGGNGAPLAYTDGWGATYNETKYGLFFSASERVKTTLTGKVVRTDDTGLYIAGDGSTGAQTALATLDGYVYAIPVFRVRRRNNAGFDPDNNPLGARDYYGVHPTATVTMTGTVVGQTSQHNFSSTDVLNFRIGDIVGDNNVAGVRAQVTAISGTTVTLQWLAVYPNPWSVSLGDIIQLQPDRPDGLYSNIIDASDIIDLRHQVSLTGFNYQALLEKNLDLLLRGQLTMNAGTRYGRDYIGLNVAAGIPDDASTLLRCIFDGGTINGTANGTQVTGTAQGGAASYVNGVQGAALAPSTSVYVSYPFSGLASGASTYSIEFLIKPNWNWNDGATHSLIGLSTSASAVLANSVLSLVKYNTNTLRLAVFNSGNTGSIGVYDGTLPTSLASSITSGTWHKILVVVNSGVPFMFIDGVSILTAIYGVSNLALATTPTYAHIGDEGNWASLANAAIDSVRISNIARTETLLPTTFNGANGDKILDGPNSDFSQWSDDLGGIVGVSGRSNPYGLSRVPNAMAAKVNVSGQEIRHYYGNGFTSGWSGAGAVGTSPTGALETYSAEYELVNANETVDGTRTTFTFNLPVNAQGLPAIFSGFASSFKVNGGYSAVSSITLNPSTGQLTATFTNTPLSGVTVQEVYTTCQRHAHFIPSTKGFIIHDWTDDSLTADGINKVFQTTKYNVVSVNHVRSMATGNNYGTVQNGGYNGAGLNAQTTLSANAAQNATTITVASGTNFVANQNIRISKGDGTWYTTTVTSVSGNTITVPALGVSLSQNAIVQGTAIVTFTTAPAAGTVDLVYESVYTPALGDYIRVMYQHTPYQGLLGTAFSGSGKYQFIFTDEDAGFITTLGTGLNSTPNVPAWMKDYPVPTAQLPINGYDYQLKHDTLSLSNNTVTGLSQQFLDNEQIYEINATNAANIYSPLAAATPTTQTNRGYSTSAVNDGASRQMVVALRDLASAVPHLVGTALLAQDTSSGELLLMVATMLRTDATNKLQIDGTSGAAIDVFKIQGRPLTKAYGGVAA